MTKLLAKISLELHSDNNINSICRIYVNKEYEVIKKYFQTDSLYYYVYDDNKEYCVFRPDQMKQFFYTEKESRKKKLNQLNENRR